MHREREKERERETERDREREREKERETAGNAPQVFPREYETDVAEIRTYDDDAGVFGRRFFYARTHIHTKKMCCAPWLEP